MKISLLAAGRMRRAQTSPLVLLLVLVIGLLVGALLVRVLVRPAPPAPEPVAAPVRLADATMQVVAKLTEPVEFRVYSLFSGDSVPPAYQEHVARIEALVTEFERYGNGRIKVTRRSSWTREHTQQATADGLTPLTLPTGDPGYVGIALAQRNRKEALSPLAPEWFPALEFDLARALTRVGSPVLASAAAVDQSQIPKATSAVQQLIPNAAAVTLEDGKQLLREAALKSYQALLAEMNREVQAAEQGIAKATTDGDRKVAVQKLQEVRAGYAEKLRAVALQSQAELEVWSRQKSQ